MLRSGALNDILSPSLALLPSEMRPSFDVSRQNTLIFIQHQIYVLLVWSSICLVVISLLTEAPHDVLYYWKCVDPLFPLL